MSPLSGDKKKEPKPIEWKPDKSQIVHLKESYDEIDKGKKK